MNRVAFFSLGALLLAAVFLPGQFPEALDAGLENLGVPADLALLYFLAMLCGAVVNIPVWSRPTPRLVCADPLAVAGLDGVLPHLTELRRRTVFTINLGGAVIPGALVIYEVVRVSLAENPHRTLIAIFLASCINAGVVWKLARPVACVGITVPGLVPPLVAAASALLLKSSDAPLVAFVSGWIGPIVGSLARFPSLKHAPVAHVSLGGAGVFDAILWSTLIAAFLAPGAAAVPA